ncbi:MULTISPECIES: hypothetical protein [unclassified Spirillospora]|uniref:hypothetical protein n=1 Tax=unclassified Spirillospora TaxID=2642701 RepID=UPI00370FDDF3
MSEEYVTYYAITGGGNTVDDPRGIVRRRRPADGGILDEALERDLEWHRTGVIAEWKRGNFARELEEVSEERAMEIVDAFRADGPY